MNNGNKALTFSDVAQFLANENSVHSVSGFHGLICGDIAGGSIDGETSLADIQLFLEISAVQDRTALKALYADITLALLDEDCAFTPLLPSDDEPLANRLSALSDWCDGFLAGFGLNNQNSGKLPQLVAEILNDMAAITQINTEEDEDWDESGEKDYYQLIEFIRLSVMNIYLEYHKQPATGRKQGEARQDVNPESLFKSRNLH